MRRGAALGVAAVLVATLLSGCDGSEESADDKEARTERALRQILEEYRPRYEERRAALAAAASHLPEGTPGEGRCDRPVNPRPLFLPYKSTDVVTSGKPGGRYGNVDAAPSGEAGTPERIADRPGPGLGRFALAPGRLIRGLWITGAQGPLGTDRFKAGADYARQPYKDAEKDPARRLRAVLDIGLHMRYVLLYRVTAYQDPAAPSGYEKAMARADVFLADLEKGDIPCRLVATGRPSYVKGHWYSTAWYADMQSSFANDIQDQLKELTRD